MKTLHVSGTLLRTDEIAANKINKYGKIKRKNI